MSRLTKAFALATASLVLNALQLLRWPDKQHGFFESAFFIVPTACLAIVHGMAIFHAMIAHRAGPRLVSINVALASWGLLLTLLTPELVPFHAYPFPFLIVNLVSVAGLFAYVSFLVAIQCIPLPDSAACPTCGYSLKGLESSICPECGRMFAPPH